MINDNDIWYEYENRVQCLSDECQNIPEGVCGGHPAGLYKQCSEW